MRFKSLVRIILKTGNLAGYSLLELLLVLAIFIPVIMLLMSSTTQLLQRQSLSTQTTEATLHLQKSMENLYAIAQTPQWDQLMPDAAPYYLEVMPSGWVITRAPDPNANFETRVLVNAAYRNVAQTGDIDPTCNSVNPDCVIDDHIRHVAVDVQWKANPGNPISATGYISNLKYLLNNIPTMPPKPTSTPKPKKTPTPTEDPSNPEPTDPPDPTNAPGGPTNTPKPTKTPGPPRPTHTPKPTATPFQCRWWWGDC